MTGQAELRYAPGGAAEFLDDLWTLTPSHASGRLIGVLHHIGDRGQILVRVANAAQQELELGVLPGQVLVAHDPQDPGTWTVVDGPAPPRLNLP